MDLQPMHLCLGGVLCGPMFIAVILGTVLFARSRKAPPPPLPPASYPPR